MTLADAIVDTLIGRDGIRRLMVSMPPRHGKSEFCSKYLPSWYLGTFKDRRVILSSYEASFAASWGRKSRNLLEEYGHLLGVEVAESPAAADAWDIKGYSGGMVTAGAGGAITGKGAHLLIVDDPIKNAEDASSATIRNRIWDWWQSTAYTRLEPDGAAVVVQTRWHEDDLCGRLIREAEGGGEAWRILKLPAISDAGEALWPERYSVERLLQIKQAVGEYYWSALYQQDPTPREGMLFQTGNLIIQPNTPTMVRVVRAWDMAASSGAGDWTTGVKMGVDAYGVFYVMNVVRGQWGTDERNRIIRQTAEMDGPGVPIRGPEDPGSAGKDSALSFVRMLSGFPVKVERVSGSKVSRADPYSAQVNVGNVRMTQGPWNRDYIEELRQFPLGQNDDQVDASADAFTELTRGIWWDHAESADEGFEVAMA